MAIDYTKTGPCEVCDKTFCLRDLKAGYRPYAKYATVCPACEAVQADTFRQIEEELVKKFNARQAVSAAKDAYLQELYELVQKGLFGHGFTKEQLVVHVKFWTDSTVEN